MYKTLGGMLPTIVVTVKILFTITLTLPKTSSAKEMELLTTTEESWKRSSLYTFSQYTDGTKLLNPTYEMKPFQLYTANQQFALDQFATLV